MDDFDRPSAADAVGRAHAPDVLARAVLQQAQRLALGQVVQVAGAGAVDDLLDELAVAVVLVDAAGAAGAAVGGQVGEGEAAAAEAGVDQPVGPFLARAGSGRPIVLNLCSS
jgi:hypothetical protein